MHKLFTFYRVILGTMGPMVTICVSMCTVMTPTLVGVFRSLLMMVCPVGMARLAANKKL